MQPHKKSILFALLSVAFWSTMSSAFKITLRYIAPDLLLLWASFFSILVLAVIIALRGQFGQLFRQSRKQFWWSAFSGLINPFAYYLVLFKAYDLLQAQEAGTLNYSWPVVLTILSVPLLGQKIGLRAFLAIQISFFGLWVISTKGQIWPVRFTNPAGVALALGSAVLWAVYWIINLKDSRDALIKIFMNTFFGGAYITAYLFFFSEIRFPAWQALAGALYIGLFEMGITFVFWLLALKYAPHTAKVNSLIFLSPFMALFFIRLFVGEAILPSTIIGLLLIVSGIILQQLPSHWFNLKLFFKK